MRKSFLAVAGAVALATGATSANAATTVTSTTPSPAILTPPASAAFSSVISSGPGTFSDSFTFTIAGQPGVLDSQISTLLLNGSQNINFTSLALDGMVTTIVGGVGTGGVFVKTSTDPNPETWAILNPIFLATGTHTINVMGNLLGPNGSYGGTINVQPVPEPATWGMMLLGFGAMGLAIRRRRKPVLAQLA
jgi:hypothetical protein